ncbi:MAG: SMC-Scp complex subunit ScpB [Planctomycetes bacterium]|nr:SMC-Scp complex subunit ScpB [Planctomycetota bacterium]
MVQGRKQTRRIEIHSPDPLEETLEDGFDEGSGDEPAISLEDLGDAYAAVLQMHQTIESDGDRNEAVDGSSGFATSRDAGSEETTDPTVDEEPRAPNPSERTGEPYLGVDNNSARVTVTDDPTSLGLSWIGESDEVPVTLVSILESICFVGTRDGKPIPLSFLVEALRDFSEAEVRDGIEALNQQLRLQNSAMFVDKVGDGFKIVLSPDLASFAEVISGPTKESQLTQAAIDCLSLVAYQPGITKDEIEKQWGQPAGGILANLSKKGLIKTDADPSGISPSREEPSPESFTLSPHSLPKTQPRYFTTERFLGILGLQSLDDLPRGDEL